MNTWGYKAQGIDYAKRTIETIKELVPELRVQVGDVRQLPFADDTFDGYWSLGVIEHFWDGFDPITKEAARVLKPGGFLFLTFPWMSPLRRLKARLGRYANIDVQHPDTFYEFMLDERSVIKKLESQGFTCVEKYPYDALKGIKDEIAFLSPILQRLYKSRFILARAARYLLTLLLARLTGHMILLVCKKSSSASR
jgi:SAM-dependent methyltransferase